MGQDWLVEMDIHETKRARKAAQPCYASLFNEMGGGYLVVSGTYRGYYKLRRIIQFRT